VATSASPSGRALASGAPPSSLGAPGGPASAGAQIALAIDGVPWHELLHAPEPEASWPA